MREMRFEVDRTYENEKGIFEVLSKDERGDRMVIKWESGEEATTTIGLQRQIIERRRYEFEAANAKKKPKGRKRPSTAPTLFQGFRDTDFSGDVAGTTWRTEKALGGAVTTLLNPDGPRINSWAVFRGPELHWIDAERSGQNDKGLQAKLFVRLDENYLYYGFYVERTDDASQVQDDWNGFVEWLSDVGNESWLKEIVAQHDLRIGNMKDDESPFDEPITAGDGSWRLGNGGHARNVESLADFLKELPDTACGNLQIAKITGKGDTIGRGDKIAGDISGLFDILMPVYRAATLHASP
jgi:hypothetical protein